MPSHVIDMIMLKNNFGTEEMRNVWSDENRLQKHINVEIALTQAEGELGVIPVEAAKEIVKQASQAHFDLEQLAANMAKLKHSLMPTINAIQEISGEHGEFVHYGATTQDIVDTGTILQLKEAHQIIQRDLRQVADALAILAKEHKLTLIAGRSHGMQGLPTTFGFKMAVVLSEILRHIERLQQIDERVFVGNISGGVGTYASFGEQGIAIEQRAMEILALQAPEICWHSSRDRLAEYASVLGLISGTLGKLANEFYNLMRTEIDEVEEPFSKGNVGSSTMPHKRNPAMFEGIASLTRPILQNVSLMQHSLIVEHERDAMSWRAEWIALPEITIYLSSQLASTIAALRGLVVKPQNMLKNLDKLGGLLLSEKIMFELSSQFGKQTAHHIIYEISMEALENDVPFKELLAKDKRIMGTFSAEQLASIFDYASYTGLAPVKVEEVLAHYEQIKKEDR
ncbi:adenylosuccinate lyase [Lysinibacillus sp. FSL H8-0500]|uniref:adenylosuccinate lyase n=1 Tax=Lysinibacillus sp. FSL H8-0500 TaxID=2921393 RepID=UPI0031012585